MQPSEGHIVTTPGYIMTFPIFHASRHYERRCVAAAFILI